MTTFPSTDHRILVTSKRLGRINVVEDGPLVEITGTKAVVEDGLPEVEATGAQVLVDGIKEVVRIGIPEEALVGIQEGALIGIKEEALIGIKEEEEIGAKVAVDLVGTKVDVGRVGIKEVGIREVETWEELVTLVGIGVIKEGGARVEEEH